MKWRKGSPIEAPAQPEQELARTGSVRRFYKIEGGHIWLREEPA